MIGAPQILDVHFDYAGERIFLRVIGRRPVVYAFTCPVCHIELQLDPRTHHLIANMMTRKATIRPNPQCPNEWCGWYAEVAEGVAQDVDPPPAPEPPAPVDNGPMRICETCGREFNPGAAARTECARCRPPASIDVRGGGIPWLGPRGPKKNRNGGRK